MRRITVFSFLALFGLVLTPVATARVLRVGSYHHVKGEYKAIQAAVNAAKPGDWILVAPGDYKTTSSRSPAGTDGEFPAGVLITKPRLHLRGMNRNTVIVDGTKRGKACNSVQADQSFGPNASGRPEGLNGVMVWKADNVSVQNLTACNFLGGSNGDGETGNEIWWNGGAESGLIGGWGYTGSYLNATSTYYNNDETTAAQYGIFSSNWSGGTWDDSYTSNFNDSGFYIGACQDVCDQTIDHAWSEFNALGYSGTNSGGELVVENSQFDNNEDGFDTNSQNVDIPPPQDGVCPNGGISPVTHTHSCWVFMHNYVHNNNNANVPAQGSAAAGPVGTGMSISGGRDDTVMDNTFANNDAWGVILVPYPDMGPPCTGGTGGQAGSTCIYDEWNDAYLNNTFTNNGGYGNSTNGDIGFTNFEPNEPTDCFSGNKDTDGTLTSAPSNIQSMYPVCNGKDQATPSSANPQSADFLTQVACDSQITFGASSVPCPPGTNYPRATDIVMHPLPPARELQTMPNPCAGVPANPWCTTRKRRGRA